MFQIEGIVSVLVKKGIVTEEILLKKEKTLKIEMAQKMSKDN